MVQVQGLEVLGHGQGLEVQVQGLVNWLSRTRTFLENNNTASVGWYYQDVWRGKVQRQLANQSLTGRIAVKPAIIRTVLFCIVYHNNIVPNHRLWMLI